MTSNFKTAHLFGIASIVVSLAACAATTEVEHRERHPESTAAQSPSVKGSDSPGANMGMMGEMDMKSMCEMHQKMMEGKTPTERSAMMNEHMKSMSPEMKQQHLDMMREKCR